MDYNANTLLASHSTSPEHGATRVSWTAQPADHVPARSLAQSHQPLIETVL